MSYKTTPVTVLPELPPIKPRRRPKRVGTTFPRITSKDTGIHTIKTLEGNRYKIWFLAGEKKRYVTLKKGTTIEEARKRRDTLYKNLREKFGAKGRTFKSVASRPPAEPTWKPGKYIYRRKPFVVRVRGKQIGEFDTEEQAQWGLNQWLKENPLT